jgi:hypothetical protein
MSRPPRSEATRLQLALTARRMVEQELTATPAPSLKEAHARVAIRLRVTPRTLRTRLAEAPATPTGKEYKAALQAYRNSPWPTAEELVATHHGDGAAAAKQVWERYLCETDNLVDMLMRHTNGIMSALRMIQ